MRIWIWKCKEFLRLAMAAIFAVVAVAVAATPRVSRLSTLDGERTFYLCSASSQGLRENELKLFELFSVRGECVRLTIEGNEAGCVVSELLDVFRAELVCVETACDVTSYYAHTSDWSDGVYIDGRCVNLHVAVCGTRLVVGSPIIFDGF